MDLFQKGCLTFDSPEYISCLNFQGCADFFYSDEVGKGECIAAKCELTARASVQSKPVTSVFLRFGVCIMKSTTFRTEICYFPSGLSLWFFTRVPQCVQGRERRDGSLGKHWEHSIIYFNNHFHQDSGTVHTKVMCAHSFVYTSVQNLATLIF